jgi:hypothetical protein
VEENINTQEAAQQPAEQIYEEKPKGLLPGQDHEDELDYLGGALFGIIKNIFKWIGHFFVKKT